MNISTATVNKESRKKSSHEKEKSQQLRFCDLEYQIRLNLPSDLPRRKTDVYLVTDLLSQQADRVEK